MRCGAGSHLHRGQTSSSPASSSRGPANDGHRLNKRPPPLYAGNQSRSAPAVPVVRVRNNIPHVPHLPPATCRQIPRSYADSLRGPAPTLVRESGAYTFRVIIDQHPDSRHFRGAFRHPNAAGASAPFLSPSLSDPHPRYHQRQYGVWSKGPGRSPLTRPYNPVAGPKRQREPRRVIFSAPPASVHDDQRSFRFTHEASRGACRDTRRCPPGSVEVASTHDPRAEWHLVSNARHRGRKSRSNGNVGPPHRPSEVRHNPRVQAAPKPTPHRSRGAQMAHDLRTLPLPEPYDKNAPHPSRNQRHQDSWNWDAWRD